ncbi:MAG: PAS domain S-box protein [Bacteroidales bacterium]|nr:PAS domain S-box protein [Bacteroidales bacterium]
MMTKADHEKNLQSKDWQKVDARVLGQILAAQNVLFVLPDEERIAEFFSQALSSVPGISSCYICLGNLPDLPVESPVFCNKCPVFQRNEDQGLILPVNFTCNRAAQQKMRSIALRTTEHTYGFFIIRTDTSDALEPYWPFLCNLANYVALSLENRMQKHLLEKSRNIMEDKVKEGTEELRQMNERFRLATSAARLGVWDWDIQKNELVWDDGMYTLYGIKKEEFAGAYEAWLNGLHPEDRNNSEEMSRLARRGEREYDTEFRVVWPDGSIHYLKAFGQIVRDSDGNPFRMTGINFDITERKLADEATRKSEQEFRTLAENIPDNILRYDLNCRAIYVNHAPEISKYFKTSIIDKTPADNSLEGGIQGIEEYASKLQKVVETGKPEETEIVLHDLQGNIHNYEVSFVSEYNSKGQISGALAIGRDITERKRNDALNSSRLHLIQFAATHPLDELLEETLNEAEKLTGSLIGFYHLVEDDQISLTLQSWSTRTKAEFCKAEIKGQHYPISQAGVWVECVVQRKPVIHNDYGSLPYRKGMPEGHAEVVRELVAPVIRGNKVKAILGVGNKTTVYDEKDVEAISFIADLVWEIAARKQVDIALGRSEEKYRTLIQKIQAGVIVHGANTQIITCNLKALEILGLTEDQLLGKISIDPARHFLREDYTILPPEEYPANLVMASREVLKNYIFGVHRSDNENDIWVLVNADPVFGDNGEIAQVIVTFIDISERQQVEATLAKTTLRLNEAQRIAHIGSWDLDLVNNVLSWSDEIYRMFEVYPDKFDASYESFLNTIHPDDRDAVNKAYTNSLKTRQSYNIDHRLLFADGRIKYVHEQCETFYDADNKPLRSMGIVQDITERKNSEDALMESNRHYHQIVDLSQDMIVIHQQGKVVFVNEAGVQLLGASKSDKLIGRSVLEFVPPENRKIAIERMQTGLSEEGYKSQVYEQKMIRFDGSVIDIELRGMPIIYQGERAIQFVAHDITERKKTEAALRRSEQEFRTLAENSPDVIVRYDREGRRIYVNPEFERVNGLTAAEVLGKKPMELSAELAPMADVFTARLMEIMESGKITKIDLSWTKDGKLICWFVRAVPEFDANGIVTGALTIWSDITERKQAEEEIRKLNLELEHRVQDRTLQLELANKELEAFSYSVSHDLRAPLRSIDGFSLALLDDYYDKIDDQGKNYLKRVRNASQRMAQLIDDMLNLSRVSRGEMSIMQVNLSNMFNEIANDLHETQPQRKIEFIIQKDIKVIGDSRLLRIVLENLIGNAFKFTSKHSAAQIEFGMQMRNDVPVYFVRDDGAGFNMNYSQKLFGAFQRLHTISEFPGTGIGLATVQRVIHRHDGNIWAEGEIEKGATFYFTLHLQKE